MDGVLLRLFLLSSRASHWEGLLSEGESPAVDALGGDEGEGGDTD